MVNEFEGFWDNTPDLNLPIAKTTKQAPHKKKHPELIQIYGTREECFKVLNPFEVWLNKDKKLIILRRVIDKVLNRISAYEEQWNNNSNNFFPVDLLRRQIEDKNLDEFLRNDRRTFELLNTKYNQGGIRNYTQWIADFKKTKNKYLSNHPWPFIGSPRKLNLHNSQDIESICIVVSYCHDLIFAEYPILTDEQKQKLSSLQYLTYCIGIFIINNYISHIKCYISKVAQNRLTESNLSAVNSLSTDLSNGKQQAVKNKNIISIIVGIVLFLAALFTCVGYFLEWFGPIKAFIYNLIVK